jgi:hypothetical protein
MAKVRVQASGGSGQQDDQDAAEKGLTPVKREPKYKGALNVLTRVLKEEGFLGWYQVRTSFEIIHYYAISHLTAYMLRRAWVPRLPRQFFLRPCCLCRRTSLRNTHSPSCSSTIALLLRRRLYRLDCCFTISVLYAYFLVAHETLGVCFLGRLIYRQFPSSCTDIPPEPNFFLHFRPLTLS